LQKDYPRVMFSRHDVSAFPFDIPDTIARALEHCIRLKQKHTMRR